MPSLIRLWRVYVLEQHYTSVGPHTNTTLPWDPTPTLHFHGTPHQHYTSMGPHTNTTLPWDPTPTLHFHGTPHQHYTSMGPHTNTTLPWDPTLTLHMYVGAVFHLHGHRGHKDIDLISCSPLYTLKSRSPGNHSSTSASTLSTTVHSSCIPLLVIGTTMSKLSA